jgi:hypothetical protein
MTYNPRAQEKALIFGLLCYHDASEARPGSIKSIRAMKLMTSG